VIEGTLSQSGQVSSLISEHIPGLDLYFDPSALDETAVARTRSLLEKAIASLEARPRRAHSSAE
jgi:hypothetical protein